MLTTPPHPKSLKWLLQALWENDWRLRGAVIGWWLNMWRVELRSAALMMVFDRIKSPIWHAVWLMISGPSWQERSGKTRVDMLRWLVESARIGPYYTTRHWRAKQPSERA